MTKIDIYEVGPRDGFQNVQAYIPFEIKMQIIERIVSSGIRHLQVTSFVSPKAIPQMKDAIEIATACKKKYPDYPLFALVPNLYGAKSAWELGIKHISYVVSLSESHNRANINRTHEESYVEFQKIRQTYQALDICLDVSTAFGCPFEGKKTAQDVLKLLKKYVEGGIRTVNLCDTIGIANPAQIRKTIAAINDTYPALHLQIHIHDTRNMGMVNTLAAIEAGVMSVQATLGGLGGCPYAPGASGNLATEDLVFMLTEMGFDTGIDLHTLLEAAKFQHQAIPEASFSGHLLHVGDAYGK